jgi:hypothetical protein
VKKLVLVLDFLKADEVYILPTPTTLSALLVSEKARCEVHKSGALGVLGYLATFLDGRRGA